MDCAAAACTAAAKSEMVEAGCVPVWLERALSAEWKCSDESPPSVRSPALIPERCVYSLVFRPDRDECAVGVEVVAELVDVDSSPLTYSHRRKSQSSKRDSRTDGGCGRFGVVIDCPG